MAGNTLSRVRNIVRAEIEDVLGRIENPRKMVNQMLVDMERAFDEAITEVSRAIANEKIVERRLRKAESEAARLRTEAEAAVNGGDEARARHILEKKVGLEMSVDALKRSHEEAKAASTKLKEQLTELRTKLESARHRKVALTIRKQQAREGIGEAARLNCGPFDDFDRLVSDVERDEIASEVYAEMRDLSAPDPEPGTAERDRKVREELDALKGRASGGA